LAARNWAKCRYPKKKINSQHPDWSASLSSSKQVKKKDWQPIIRKKFKFEFKEAVQGKTLAANHSQKFKFEFKEAVQEKRLAVNHPQEVQV
jgi:hypothetical protein